RLDRNPESFVEGLRIRYRIILARLQAVVPRHLDDVAAEILVLHVEVKQAVRPQLLEVSEDAKGPIDIFPRLIPVYVRDDELLSGTRLAKKFVLCPLAFGR